MEIFPEWNPSLNKKHFPRSADSEWVSVLAGQRADGVIVPLNIALVDGTTNQYALTVNTEITMPPITIGKVIVQGVDSGGTKHDIFALLMPDGSWSLSVASPTLALEASQLTQIGLLNGQIVLSAQEVAQLSQLLVTAATEATQLSILYQLAGLTFDSPALAQEVTQLSILYQIQGLTFDSPALNQEATQLSVLAAIEGLSINLNSDTLNQEVTQLSVLYQLQGLTFNSPALDQEVTQLSVLQTLQQLSVIVNDFLQNGLYFSFDGSQAGGLTDVAYTFPSRMQDVYLNVSNPVTIKFNSTANTAIPLLRGQFDFGNQYAAVLYLTTTKNTDVQIYANGGIA